MKKIKDIQKIVNIYKDTFVLEQSDIYDLFLSSTGDIKWFSPNPDCPQILDTYRLSSPFYYDSSSQSLKASKESGERREIIWTVRCLLGEIAQKA